MLHTQKYLRGGKTPADLLAELGIVSFEHPSLPLTGFTYHQINSPKAHPIVKECRGLVLERDTWNIVAKGFDRFFNAGEDAENFAKFNWSKFSTQEKVDGSLILMYWYRGVWHANTRGSFGFGLVGDSGKSWRELFFETLGFNAKNLSPAVTYVFELCTKWNKVVRYYEKPVACLLTVVETFDEGNVKEYPSSWCGFLKDQWPIVLPEQYHFTSRDEIAAFLQSKEETDKTFEGVVVRDSNGMRCKVKSKTYLALHHLKDNGNYLSPKHMVPLVLNGELDEVVAYFPECKPYAVETRDKLQNEFANLLDVWMRNRSTESQKEFAQAVVPATKLSGILFQLRKENRLAGELELLEKWKQSSAVIVNNLFTAR